MPQISRPGIQLGTHATGHDAEPRRSFRYHAGMNTRTLDYGSWPSAVTAELVAGKALRLAQSQALADGGVAWTESRPEESGRSVLVRWKEDKCEDMTPEPFSVQSRANGYGGGVFVIHGDEAWFVNKSDQQIYHRHADGRISQLTDRAGILYGDLTADFSRQRLLVIAEIERDSAEPATVLAAVSLENGELRILDDRHDFHSTPVLSPDEQQLAWISWNHPDMPWDTTTLWLSKLDDAGFPVEPVAIAGGENESILQPGWLPDGRLLFVSDRNDWWNLYEYIAGELARPLCEMDAEFAVPHWVFGMRTWSALNDGQLACAWTRDGSWQAGIMDAATGRIDVLDIPLTHVDHLSAGPAGIILQGGAADRSSGVWRYSDGVAECLRSAGEPDLPEGSLSSPESVSFPTTDNDIAHALYYPPASPDIRGPDIHDQAGSAPPLLVKCHGGPTGATSAMLDMKIQYWTSRGFAVLDVNYRGSTGYGRAYRKKLYGNWGISDVADAIHGARAMADAGKADPDRMVISGSSAGGYTVLCALTFHNVFAAGASYYGVSEPMSCMRETEKFESRYGDRLIAPLPEEEATWKERTPLLHADRIRVPIIFFQGLDDRIVLPEQSRQMHEALCKNGVPTASLEFSGEGHGFRQAGTIITALESEYAFYCRVLDIEPNHESSEQAGQQRSKKHGKQPPTLEILNAGNISRPGD